MMRALDKVGKKTEEELVREYEEKGVARVGDAGPPRLREDVGLSRRGPRETGREPGSSLPMASPSLADALKAERSPERRVQPEHSPRHRTTTRE